MKLSLVRRLIGKINLTACLFFFFNNGNIKASFCKQLSRGKTRNTCTDYNNPSAVSVFRQLFTFSADKRINRAVTVLTDICTLHHTFKAVKAADTAFDFIFSVFKHLIAPMRICNMRSAKCNKILYTLLKLLLSLFRRTDKISGNNRNINRLFYLCR